MANEDYKKFFDANGYVVVPNIISPAQLAELSAMVDQVLDGTIRPDLTEPDGSTHLEDFKLQLEPAVADDDAVSRCDKIRVAYSLCHTHSYFQQHATRPELVDVARALIGPEIRLYADQLFNKPAHHGSEVPFHQDHAYWKALEPYNLVSCWLALDDATIENGCVRMIPGTHHSLVPHQRYDGTQTWGLPEDEVDATSEKPIEIPAGSAMFHHSIAIHRSFPNNSDRGRRGLVVIYAPDETQIVSPWPFPYGLREINGYALGETLLYSADGK